MTTCQAIEPQDYGCDGQEVLKHLIDVDEALARLKAHIAPVTGIETVPLDRATSRVLARLVRSRAMAPGFDNAAMDGYALATHDLTGDGP